MPETRTVGFGVIIGQPGAEALLEANKAAFVLAFVQRPEFQAAYPAGMTAQAFVDLMDTNAGSVLSSTEKSNLVAALNTRASRARARVLRAFADNRT